MNLIYDGEIVNNIICTNMIVLPGMLIGEIIYSFTGYYSR